MTDIITNPIATRSWGLPHIRLSKLGIGCTFSAISEATMQAFEMAYVAPFKTMQRKPSIIFDENLEGRDPNW